MRVGDIRSYDEEIVAVVSLPQARRDGDSVAGCSEPLGDGVSDPSVAAGDKDERVRSPSHHHAAPGHAGPKAAHQDHGARFQHPCLVGGSHRHRDAGAGCIARVFKHVEGLLHGDAEPLGHGFDDANVRLVEGRRRCPRR